MSAVRALRCLAPCRGVEVAEGFAALGLSDAVVEAARAAGYERPSPLQEAASNVLRRGSNVVLHGSSGAGVAAAFGMPLLDRLSAGEAIGTGPRALVLAPTQQRAELLATGLSGLAGSTGVAVLGVRVAFPLATQADASEMLTGVEAGAFAKVTVSAA
jgi:superfamily II DNA/RNA helicase